MGLFGKLVNLAINVVETPIAIVKDAATLGGALTDQKRPYTVQKLDEMEKRVNKIKNDLDNL